MTPIIPIEVISSLCSKPNQPQTSPVREEDLPVRCAPQEVKQPKAVLEKPPFWRRICTVLKNAAIVVTAVLGAVASLVNAISHFRNSDTRRKSRVAFA